MTGMIERFCAQGIAAWNETSPDIVLSPWYIGDEKRTQYEHQISVFYTDLRQYFHAFPKSKSAQAYWKEQGMDYLEACLKEGRLPLLDGMNERECQLFQKITTAFLRDVRAFDASLSLADVMQALRNVWIIAILQCLFQKPIGYHPAMFAYSMLYPYSDNYLDDPSIPLAQKQRFNAWFSARLQGIQEPHHHPLEAKISDLVAMIETQFPRTEYAQVYDALYAIHHGQMRSLHQQDGTKRCDDEALLAISYEKGGTSVVADGFLMDGTLSEEQQDFCMRYGFMLQLGDDLQDGTTDALAKHQTLVANHMDQCQDELVKRLLHFTRDLLQPSSLCTDERLLHFVLHDCLYLIFLALMKEDGVRISSSLRKQIQSCLPVSPAFLASFREQCSFSFEEAQWWERIDALLL